MTLVIVALFVATSLVAAEPLDIGSRLELFVDDYLIGELQGDAKLHLHKPEPKEIVLITDRPWEGARAKISRCVVKTVLNLHI